MAGVLKRWDGSEWVPHIGAPGNLSRISLETGSGIDLPLNFIDDPDTGLYRFTDNQMMFTAGGTDILRIVPDRVVFNKKIQIAGNITISENSSQIVGQPRDQAAPSFTFFNDEDTGMFQAGANILGIATGGAERLRVSNTEMSSTIPITAPIKTNTVTANYTLALADASGVVEMNHTSARTITIPPNSTTAFPVGTVINLYRMGTGTVTVLAGSGVTIRRAASAATLRAQYSEATLRKRGTDEWVLSGDLG